MRLPLLLAVAVMLSASAAARADLIYDYTLNATLAGGGTVTGVVYIHAMFGGVGYFAFTAEDGGSTYNNLVLNGVDPTAVGPDEYLIVASDDFITPEHRGTEFYLYLPIGNLAYYPGSAICSTSNPCGPSGTDVSYLRFDSHYQPAVTSGTLDFVPPIGTSPVPELSSIVLLGTGMLGVIGVVKQRYA